jgi:hypothetical protein
MRIAGRARARLRRAPRGESPTNVPAISAALACVLAAALALTSGCGTSHPRALKASTLAEAQTFPYFPVYWVGRSFEGQPLDAVDGRKTYIPSVGESVYYGDCAHGKGIFGGGSCVLPLQVTTSVWHLHTNASLGTSHNLLIRGVPAATFDEGSSIELYTGQLAIDVFSDSPERALRAAMSLVPVNAPASAPGRLPEPVYCPELVGAVDATLERVLDHLPGRICQLARAAKEINLKLS